jgi:uncharacterized membrane protein
MVTAAKTISQVFTHAAIAFSIAYWFTGSAVFGGLAAVLEPIINVAVLPFHQQLWNTLRSKAKDTSRRARFLIAEKISQVGMHMAIAFGVMFWATGSIAFGGLAAILEPICNVLLLPFHDRAWENFRAKVSLNLPRRSSAA